MTKKFISLLMLVVMVVGLIPVMSVSAAPVIDRYDTFETYTVKEFNTDFTFSSTLTTIYDTGDSSNYNQKFSLGKDLSLKVFEMPGYDGQMTNVGEFTINSSGASSQTPGTLRLFGSKIYGSGNIYVQEMDVYITDNPNNQEFMMFPIIITGEKIGFGKSSSSVTYKNVGPGWHRVKAVTLLGEEENNVIGYIDGEVFSYKTYTLSKPYKYFQLDNYEKGYKTIIFDNIKLWADPDATTASSVYSDASNVAINKNITVDFSQELLDTTIDSVKTISAANVLMSNSDGDDVVLTSVTMGADNKSIVIDPAENLEKGMQYNVTVTGLKDMYDREIADCEFSFTTVEESKISCAQPTFKKENLFAYVNQGTTLSALENGYISASLAVSNRDTSAREAFVLAVLKENGNIKSFQFESVTIPAQGSAPFSCGFQVDDAENQTIETFVWDSFSGKTPLASKWTLSNSGCTETIIEEQ